MVSAARTTVLKTIESRLNITIGPHIVHESVNTPQSWKSVFNLDRGAILGLSHSFFNVLCFRPKTTHPKIKQLFFVGASTHPGTGVPIVLAGAKLVSEQVLKAWRLSVPWQARKGQAEAKEVGALDKVQCLPVFEWLHWVLVLLFAILFSVFGNMFNGWDWGKGTFSGDW